MYNLAKMYTDTSYHDKSEQREEFESDRKNSKKQYGQQQKITQFEKKY